MEVDVHPYDFDWPKQFQRERQRLLSALGSLQARIEHIGSTAVPLLSAKPVIDIQVGVESLEEFDRSGAAARIEALGYRHRVDLQPLVPFRRFFGRCSDPGAPDSNIHLVEIGHPWWDRHLVLRDYLRANGDARLTYEMLKIELAGREWPDIGGYTDAKSETILRLEEAFEHFGLGVEERERLRSDRVG